MNPAELQKDTIVADRYVLKQFIGSGSFGEVWRAEDKELGFDVAIKLYITLNQQGLSEFKYEYKIAYGLIHENLLAASYYSVWENRPFLIMQYCSRGAVSSKAGKMSENDLWHFIHDVAAGLKFLHEQKPPIIHQDIKPDNILIDDHGVYKITDFGISKKLRSTMRKQSKRASTAGAVAYMGPERFLAEPISVKAGDIWSLGVSVYELATGSLPFLGQGGGMLNSGAALPNLPDKFSTNLNEVMQLCLSKETWDRPNARDLEDYTREVLRGDKRSYAVWKGGRQPNLPPNNPTVKEDPKPFDPKVTNRMDKKQKPTIPEIDINPTKSVNARTKKNRGIVWSMVLLILLVVAIVGRFKYIEYKENKEYEEWVAEQERIRLEKEAERQELISIVNDDLRPINNNLPLTMSDGVVFRSINVDAGDNYCVFTYNIPSSSRLHNMSDSELRQVMVNETYDYMGSNYSLYEHIADADLGVKYVYSGSNSSFFKEVSITSSELRGIINNCVTDSVAF